MTDREYVMEILKSRQTIPHRTPQQWHQFLTALDSWYMSDQADCKATLGRCYMGALLRQFTVPMSDLPEGQLLNLAREETNSQRQRELYDEAWLRWEAKGHAECAEFLNSIPTLYQAKFRKRLAETWVKDKGVNALTEMAATTAATEPLVELAMKLCASERPNEVLSYLKSENSAGLITRFNNAIYFLKWNALRSASPERVIQELSADAPSEMRNSSLEAAVGRAVKNDPKIAERVITNDPKMAPVLSRIAINLCKENPAASAAILNTVPGERQRRFALDRILNRLDSDKSASFINALSDPLTKAIAEESFKKRTPALNPKK